ncbi:MAG: dihydropteroate synthase [Alphaproteobacteria bacterium TMED89]|nr:dihydropteroate synthase [Rhodospirillaceae bacterium]RPH10683.1 MAG: dihydropteroate synthase [Alphaproteobacteria bacterium TMED89]
MTDEDFHVTHWAGLSLQQPHVMGILNVTPDSFSDGGKFDQIDTALAQAQRMVAQGASIIDVGGESTRPGAAEVSIDDEIQRVIPVVKALSAEGVLVSIDTRKPAVMQAAAVAGAGIINDVTGLTGDPASLATALDLDLPVCVMHMQGEPQTMQANPSYEDAPAEVFEFLAGQAEALMRGGMIADKICLDPGIGFGKNLNHNLQILARLDELVDAGWPVLLGASRKSFISKLTGADVDQRLGGSLAAVMAGYGAGVSLFRVHDVAETVQALQVAAAISEAL